MLKLPEHSLINIERTEIKTLFKENKDISGFKDYIREYINSILQENNTDKFEKDDFELIKWYIEVKEDYVKILKKIIPNFSYKILDILSQWKTLEEFEKFCNDDSIKHILTKITEKRLEYIIDLYNITSPEEFEKLCNYLSNHAFTLAGLLMDLTEKNLEYIIKLYNVKTSEEFEKLTDNPNVTNFLRKVKEKTLNFFTKIYRIETPEDFEKYCNEHSYNSTRAVSFLDINENIFEYAINLYEIKAPIFFRYLLNNDNVISFLKNIKEEDFKYAIKVYNIKTPEEFEKLCNNFEIRSIFINKKQKNIDFFINLYNIKTPEEFEKLCNIDGMIWLINSELTNELSTLEVDKSKILDFLNKDVLKSKNNIRIFANYNSMPLS